MRARMLKVSLLKILPDPANRTMSLSGLGLLIDDIPVCLVRIALRLTRVDAQV